MMENIQPPVYGIIKYSFMMYNNNFNKLKFQMIILNWYFHNITFQVYCVSFSSDDSLFTSASEDTNIFVYIVQNNFQKLKSIKSHMSEVNFSLIIKIFCINFSSKGDYFVSGSEDTKIVVHDVKNDFLVKNTLTLHKSYVKLSYNLGFLCSFQL